VKRTKKETALGRHRKWLADLQRAKDDADAASAQEAAAKVPQWGRHRYN